MSAKITASIMCADLMNLEKDIRELESAGVDYFHYDIMDGHFVPNITLGLEQIRRIQAITKVPSDFHLLTNKPEEIIPLLDVKPGDLIGFHYEGSTCVEHCIRLIHKLGAKAGIVLNPETNFTVLEPYVNQIDFVNLMMIEPGFAGQPYVSGMMDKIDYTRKWLDEYGREEVLIMVDGSITYERARSMSSLGGDMLVAGTSSLFNGKTSFQEAIELFRDYTTHGKK